MTKLVKMVKVLIMSIIVTIMITPAMNSQARSAVRVNDYKVNEFVSEYNKIARNTQFIYNLMINENPHYDDSMSDSIYNVYDVFCGSEGHGSIIVMFANKEGHVSKVSLIFGYQDEISAVSASTINVILFQTLGFNQEEIMSLSNTISNSPQNNNFIFWCMAIKRYIHVDKVYQSNGLLRIDMSAEA